MVSAHAFNKDYQVTDPCMPGQESLLICRSLYSPLYVIIQIHILRQMVLNAAANPAASDNFSPAQTHEISIDETEQ